MKLIAICLIFVFISALGVTAQTPGDSPGDKSDTAQLEMITKKLDEQTMKIDALSQQILKLEQQVGAIRPGVMIGEPTPPLLAPAPAASASPATADARASANGGHVVAKGETLTSIAKTHRVSVEELQKFNHIENDRKLQIGQTIMLPASASAASPSPSATPSPSPNG